MEGLSLLTEGVQAVVEETKVQTQRISKGIGEEKMGRLGGEAAMGKGSTEKEDTGMKYYEVVGKMSPGQT